MIVSLIIFFHSFFKSKKVWLSTMENVSHSISVPVYITLYLKPLRRLLDQTVTAWSTVQLPNHLLIDFLRHNMYRFGIGKPVPIPSGLRIAHSAIIVFQLKNQLLVKKIPGANWMLSKMLTINWKAVKTTSVFNSYFIQATFSIKCIIILAIWYCLSLW